MSSKELWASKIISPKEKPWKSPSTGAEFIVRQPNSGETIELVALNLELKNDPRKLRDVLVYVWTHNVLDKDTRQPAFTLGDEALIMAGDFGELLEVMNTVFELLPSTDEKSIEAMRKNSKQTRRH